MKITAVLTRARGLTIEGQEAEHDASRIDVPGAPRLGVESSEVASLVPLVRG